ncbi:MAG: hypothetical protein WAQ28_17985 [Bacteroidia bacterium]|jgi:hypothetical protein
MKKVLLLLAAPAILFLAACGGSKTEDKTTIPGMMETSIKVNSNDLSIMIPDSTKGIAEIMEQPWGATEIKVGADFHISIEENEGDIALMKTDITGNEVFKLQRYIKDEPALLFWESKNENMPDARFHYYAIVKAGNLTYVVKDVERLEAYNEKAVETMVQASQTLKPKTADKPNS